VPAGVSVEGGAGAEPAGHGLRVGADHDHSAAERVQPAAAAHIEYLLLRPAVRLQRGGPK